MPRLRGALFFRVRRVAGVPYGTGGRPRGARAGICPARIKKVRIVFYGLPNDFGSLLLPGTKSIREWILGQTKRSSKLIAAGVHSFTALGSVTGFMALTEILNGSPAAALLWLGLAMVIDGLDGPLARYFSINESLPHVDGVVLDNVIDYLTYSLIPAVFLYYFNFLPSGWGIAGAAVILMTSLYSFANRELKTRDNFFDGFPATWNLIVLGFYLLGTPAFFNGIVIVLCAALTFFPVKFIHPFRVKKLRPITIPITVVWAVLTVYLISERRAGFSLPNDHTFLVSVFLAISAYFVAISIIRSVRGRL